MNYAKEQKQVCEKHGATFCESPFLLKVGVSRNIKDGIWPINGLRHSPKGDTTGWYIWAGEEFSTEIDFFVPMHVEHLEQSCPIVLKYLGLAPGWRFLLANGYEDAWQDFSLIDME